MTITKYDRVAILPKRCDKCNRLFWLESYNIFNRAIGIDGHSIEYIECKNCAKKVRKNNELQDLHKSYSDFWKQ